MADFRQQDRGSVDNSQHIGSAMPLIDHGLLPQTALETSYGVRSKFHEHSARDSASVAIRIALEECVKVCMACNWLAVTDF